MVHGPSVSIWLHISAKIYMKNAIFTVNRIGVAQNNQQRKGSRIPSPPNQLPLFCPVTRTVACVRCMALELTRDP